MKRGFILCLYRSAVIVRAAISAYVLSTAGGAEFVGCKRKGEEEERAGKELGGLHCHCKKGSFWSEMDLTNFVFSSRSV